MGYEVVEQLNWRAPDRVVVPLASGSLLTKVYKGMNELYQLGLIDEFKTKITGADCVGCDPITKAFKAGVDIIRPVKPNTIAKSLAIGNPADGYYALKVIQQTGGVAESVNDQEIVEGIKLLARTEGIFTETAGGVTIATLKKLLEQGRIGRDELTVAFITGNGLKTQEAVVDAIPDPQVIQPKIDAFEEVFKLGDS